MDVFLWKNLNFWNFKQLKMWNFSSRNLVLDDSSLTSMIIFFKKQYRARETSIGCGHREHVEQHPPRKLVMSWAPLTECCGWVWWCTPSCLGSPMTSHAALIFFSLESHQSCLLFALIFFHPHNFNFFLFKYKFWK